VEWKLSPPSVDPVDPPASGTPLETSLGSGKMGRSCSAERPHCSASWGVRAGIIAAASLIGTVPTAEAFAPGRAGAFVAPQALGGLASGSRGLVCADLPDGQGMLAGRRAGAIVGRQLGGSEKFIGGARSGVESSSFLHARCVFSDCTISADLGCQGNRWGGFRCARAPSCFPPAASRLSLHRMQSRRPLERLWRPEITHKDYSNAGPWPPQHRAGL